jgi:hypothetical protein
VNARTVWIYELRHDVFIPSALLVRLPPPFSYIGPNYRLTPRNLKTTTKAENRQGCIQIVIDNVKYVIIDGISTSPSFPSSVINPLPDLSSSTRNPHERDLVNDQEIRGKEKKEKKRRGRRGDEHRYARCACPHGDGKQPTPSTWCVRPHLDGPEGRNCWHLRLRGFI